MLDKLFLKHLSKKGKILYWVGQILFDAIWAFYVFGVAGYSFEDGGETVLIIGMLIVLVGWGVICLMLWKKKNESEDIKLTSEI